MVLKTYIRTGTFILPLAVVKRKVSYNSYTIAIYDDVFSQVFQNRSGKSNGIGKSMARKLPKG